ncbi:MAG: glutamate racemase [Verrucomicrobiota bacterium]|jgi:glutamate racemase|nr:glutamate racemase [Verrucomicrobiota bacterium]MEA3206233.1 glutamate racemase [Verrucomicrobiota bacterium]
MHASEPALRPIGVFDSGIGGLTVVRALRDLLPQEDIFYIGDTARLPYGGKSKSTIERYSIEISGLLLAENAKMIVVACNTSSSLAVAKLQEILKVPVVGVIAPGARAAVKETRIGHVGVIGTKSTISSEAYERAIKALNPAVRVTSQACPLLVPLVEEAWLMDKVTREVLHRYLDPVIRAGIDTLVLGCTHYPLLAPLIQEVAGSAVKLVDSAKNCAVAVKQTLVECELENTSDGSGKLNVALTDSSNSFLTTARQALQLEINSLETRIVQGMVLVETI